VESSPYGHAHIEIPYKKSGVKKLAWGMLDQIHIQTPSRLPPTHLSFFGIPNNQKLIDHLRAIDSDWLGGAHIYTFKLFTYFFVVGPPFIFYFYPNQNDYDFGINRQSFHKPRI
jgi:hypothetical protein